MQLMTLYSPHSDLYITVQLWADSKPLTVPVQTAYKSFRNERKYVSQNHTMAYNKSLVANTTADGTNGLLSL